MVVDPGDTLHEVVPVTSPMPWLRLRLSASVELHDRIAEEPSHMVVASALMLTVGSMFTVTVTVALRDPMVLTAVRVYAVVTAGLTARVPGVFAVTVPMPPSMLTESALKLLHESVEDSPWVIASGNAAILTCGKPSTDTVISAVSDP